MWKVDHCFLSIGMLHVHDVGKDGLKLKRIGSYPVFPVPINSTLFGQPGRFLLLLGAAVRFDPCQNPLLPGGSVSSRTSVEDLAVSA